MDALNEGKEKSKNQKLTFKAMFQSELSGFIQDFKPEISAEISALIREQTGRLPTEAEWKEEPRQLL